MTNKTFRAGLQTFQRQAFVACTIKVTLLTGNRNQLAIAQVFSVLKIQLWIKG
ncbi:hypothetical protein [Nostoc sp.]|uniref:hypothetical protein n=1 Tax=Nostoc sp. TaxID=1180 RepID=UPI002FF82186